MELLDGLQILRLCETERDGQAFSGPKHQPGSARAGAVNGSS